MKNPLTFQVESSLGAVFLSLLSVFFIGLLFIAMKNFSSDIDVLSAVSGNNKVVRMSQTERLLIWQWVSDNEIEIPEDQGYNYLIKKYPLRPWLEQ